MYIRQGSPQEVVSLLFLLRSTCTYMYMYMHVHDMTHGDATCIHAVSGDKQCIIISDIFKVGGAQGFPTPKLNFLFGVLVHVPVPGHSRLFNITH